MKENTRSFWRAGRIVFYMALIYLACMMGIRTQAAESKAAVLLKEPKIISVGADASVTTALRVTWEPVDQADGYIIYRKDGNSTTWERIKKVAGQSKSYYSNIQLTPGTKYTYSVQSFCQVDGKVYYSGRYNTPVSAVTNMKTPTLKSAKSVDYKQIRIDWTPVTGAQGYRIYRREAGTGWTLVRRIAGQSKYFCIDSTAVTGRQYYYTVRATCSWDGKLYASGYNTTGIAGKAVLGTSAITSIGVKDGQVALTWKQIPGAQGYVVMRSATLDGTYTKIRTAQGVTDTSYVDPNVTSGSTYYYKVRAFKQVDGKFVYGGYSAVKSATKQMVEIMNYISINYNGQTIVSDMARLAAAIGKYQYGTTERIYEWYVDDVLMQKIINPGEGEADVIVQNTGNDGVTLYSIRLGDTYATVKSKLMVKGFEELGYVNADFNYLFRYQNGSVAVGVRIVGGRMTGYKFVQLDPATASSISSVSTERWAALMNEE